MKSDPSPSAPSLEIRHIPEPQLEFGFEQKLEYPRDGLYLYGPPSGEAPVSEVRYGVIGTAQGVQRFRAWSRMVSGFIDVPEPTSRSREIEPQHIPFPGFEQAFGARWDAQAAQTISGEVSHREDDIRPGGRNRQLRDPGVRVQHQKIERVAAPCIPLQEPVHGFQIGQIDQKQLMGPVRADAPEFRQRTLPARAASAKDMQREAVSGQLQGGGPADAIGPSRDEGGFRRGQGRVRSVRIAICRSLQCSIFVEINQPSLFR